MSLAVLKRKTFTNNPREAPISGKAGGSNFGFSLNGTRRGNHMGRETNLAPGAMTGSPQLIASTPSNPTGPGLYGHPASVCTNDPTVVKTTVMNTRGMLARKLRGIERIPPMAPLRTQVNCISQHPNSCGCSMGDIIEEAQPYISCSDKQINCVGPLTQNWVKHPSIPNGNQGEYIHRIVRVGGRHRPHKGPCLHSTKSYNGIIGILDAEALEAIQTNSQGCSTNGRLPKNVVNELVKSNSIMPFTSLCERMNVNIPVEYRNCSNRTPVRGIESWRTNYRSRRNTFPITKPGINTVDYGTYLRRGLLVNNCLPSKGHNMPRPNPDLNTKCGKNTNTWNVNVTPEVGTVAGMTWLADGDVVATFNADGTVPVGGEVEEPLAWKQCPKNNCIALGSIRSGDEWVSRYCFENPPPQASKYLMYKQAPPGANLDDACELDSVGTMSTGPYEWERT